MAIWITPQGIILNELNGKNARNIQRYQHIIKWSPEPLGETFVSGSITTGITQFPKGLQYQFVGYTIPITGIPTDVDTYHPQVKDYLSPSFQLQGDEWKEMYMDEYVKATIADIKDSPMHYTGKTWPYRGVRGLYLNGGQLLFTFNVILNTIWNSPPDGKPVPKTTVGTFTIKMVPNSKPIEFLRKYGDNNEYTNDKSEKIGTSEYESLMIGKGFTFLQDDFTAPRNE